MAPDLAGIACIVACIVLAALAVLQVAVAAGAPWGRLVWGGAHRTLPARLRIGSVLSVALYVAFAALLLSRVGVLPGGESIVIRVLTWILFAYFALGILMNAVSRSVVERATMTPVSVILAVATLVIALS